MTPFLSTRLSLGRFLGQPGKTTYLKSSNEAFNATLFAYDHEVKKRTVFVVLPNLYDAQKTYDLLSRMVDPDDLLFYPADQTLTAMMALGSPEFKSERLFTLKQLMTKDPYVVVTTPHGFGARQLKPFDYANGVRIVTKGASYAIDDLVSFMVNSGYVRTYTVEKPGEFALRGHILDIFTLNNDQPYRLDFFDVELERIKIFDVETQRSYADIEKLEIAPMNELFYTDSMKEKAIKDIRAFFQTMSLSEREKEKLESDLSHIESRSKMDSLSIYMPFFNTDPTTLADFAGEHVVYMVDPHKMVINEDTAASDLETYATTMNGHAFIRIPFRLPLRDLFEKPHVAIDTFGLNSPEKAIDMMTRDVNHYQGNLDLMLLDIKDVMDRRTILFAIEDRIREQELKSFFDKQKISYETTMTDEIGIKITDTKVAGSFDAYGDGLMVIDEGHLFKSRTRAAIKYRSVLNQAKKIRKAEDLEVGDFVVHYDYGIGRYVGLKTMELSGDKRDYLHIVYAQDENAHIARRIRSSVSNIYTVTPLNTQRLSKLGGNGGPRPKQVSG